MAFESLADKLQNVFKNLRGKGRLTEADVKAALKEVKMALLEADVSFKVVKQFISSVQERAIGQDVLESLTPGQMVIKIVNEELVKLMGSETTEIALKPQNEITVIMMIGLQGAGKTTTTAKLAGKFKAKGRKPLLAACDVYRPAAIKQLQVNGEKVGVPVFTMGDNQNPVNIAKAAVEHARKEGMNLVFLDTAGRLHIDEEMMEELQEIELCYFYGEDDEVTSYYREQRLYPLLGTHNSSVSWGYLSNEFAALTPYKINTLDEAITAGGYAQNKFGFIQATITASPKYIEDYKYSTDLKRGVSLTEATHPTLEGIYIITLQKFTEWPNRDIYNSNFAVFRVKELVPGKAGYITLEVKASPEYLY